MDVQNELNISSCNKNYTLLPCQNNRRNEEIVAFLLNFVKFPYKIVVD